MDITLSEFQKQKIEELINTKQLLEDKINLIQKSINDITDIILDINNINKNDILELGYKDGCFQIKK
jgi:prefoldin subunit 5